MLKRILSVALAALLSTTAFAAGSNTINRTATATTATSTVVLSTTAESAPGTVIVQNDGSVAIFVDFGRAAVANATTAIKINPCQSAVIRFNGNRPLDARFITAAGASSARVVGVLTRPVDPAKYQAERIVEFSRNDGCDSLASAASALPMTGAAVASATELPAPTGKLFHVTGTTNITSIATAGVATGAVFTIIFDGILTFTDGSNLKLAGNLVTTADDTITLGFDGTSFFEIARSVN